MKVLAAVLLALLLCGQPGRGQAQDEEDNDDVDFGLDGYDDDEEEEEEEEKASVTAGGRGRATLQCYSCQALHGGESCDQIQSCVHSHGFCKAVLSHGNTGSGPLTTYSAWCADTCQPFAKTVEGTLMTLTCCQSTLCNLPPWQDPLGGGGGGGGAGSTRGSPTVVATLLLSLLVGLQAVGS